MSSLTEENSGKSVRELNRSFIWRAFVGVFVLASIVAIIIFIVVKYLALENDLKHFNALLLDLNSLETGTSTPIELQAIQDFGSKLVSSGQVLEVSIYTVDKQVLWASHEIDSLNSRDSEKISQLLRNRTTNSVVWDARAELFHQPSLTAFLQLFKPDDGELDTLSVFFDEIGLAKFVIASVRDYSGVNKLAILTSILSFLAVLLSGLLILMIFSKLFRNIDQLIKDDETILNNQVAKLSILLEENKELQRNMKSASSRAVELNERFLRRVGSDLHDGPAQSIGFALLRLNQVSSKQISEELGQEFHAVKESLNESLEEIRGISSGLVLPELEQMSLEESIAKVIERHKLNTSTEVNETYHNIPREIPLPIKICAYRFVQEGLNNAYKHGGADKCRFTAQMMNGVLHLSLKDNGMGFRISTLNTEGGHLGLAGMKDRIESLGGKLSVNSELGVGTALKVSVRIADS